MGRLPLHAALLLVAHYLCLMACQSLLLLDQLSCPSVSFLGLLCGLFVCKHMSVSKPAVRSSLTLTEYTWYKKKHVEEKKITEVPKNTYDWTKNWLFFFKGKSNFCILFTKDIILLSAPDRLIIFYP